MLVARVGSASSQTSLLTTFTGYEATNPPPVAADESYTTSEDTVLIVVAPGAPSNEIHQGNGFTLAETGGAEEITLTASQIPAHSHPLLASTSNASSAGASGNLLAQPSSYTPYIAMPAGSALNTSVISATGGSIHIMDTSRDLTLRPIAPDDIELLYRIYAGTREEELAQVAWSAEQKNIFFWEAKPPKPSAKGRCISPGAYCAASCSSLGTRDNCHGCG